MEKTEKIFTVRSIVMLLVVIVLMPFLPMIISGKWVWWEAWFYALGSIFSFGISRYLAGKKSPGLISERANQGQHDDTQSWDKVLSPLTGFGGIAILIVIGLDALLGWTTPIGLFLRLIGILIFVAGHLLGDYALYENAFFSSVVRLQEDRGHHVISTGPYGWVRHPGYAGALLTYLSMPLMLNSWWAFVPVGVIFAALIARTALEDRFLQANLQGYQEFTEKTRYRLFPGIW